MKAGGSRMRHDARGERERAMTDGRRSRSPWLRWFGLLAGLLSLPLHAATPLERIGALVWEMGEVRTDFYNQRIARGVTPEKVDSLAASAARKLVGSRDALAALVPQIEAGSRLAVELQTFVDAWPDRQSFNDDLLNSGLGDRMGQMLGSLQGQARDTRSRWKTPFPFMRP